jgi:hypothetical protein
MLPFLLQSALCSSGEVTMKRPKQARTPNRGKSRTNSPARLEAEQVRLASLVLQNQRLGEYAKRAVAESYSLYGQFLRSCESLAEVGSATESLVARGRRRRKITGSSSVERECPPTTDLAYLLDALQQATEILQTGFAETAGSGRQTLDKCRMALHRARTGLHPVRSRHAA